ncbi:hypothetical protein ABOM_003395 [Aspergillus bombycis]|uniref:Uncharacterized protein n=1 Tax=Aspergillus bombycis TaxID=109264 RepID=A0A1F8A9P3_9EURO|nr:hypothetical protein ABOM_003395 [Aspergillus bombycis]OGM48427.1 hypothetical protein ABOM_003395 [Aspergillus bombycis]
MLLPKLCYLFLLFLGLVATSPVALEERSLLDPRPPNLADIVKEQTPKNVNFGNSKLEKNKKFLLYRSVVTFKDGNKVEDKHIVGLAKAGWDRMNELYNAETNPNRANRPTVMTAMKVDNKVYLASSVTGGSGNYIYQGFEDNGYEGEFTSVLNAAPDVKAALEAVSAESKEKDKKTTDKGKKTAAKVDKRTNGQQSAAGSSSGQGATNTKKKQPATPKIAQHTMNAGCGEVMASLEYQIDQKGAALRNKSPKPTIVAWEGEKGGKPIKNKYNGQITDGMTGQMKPPCGNKSKDGCGKGWGCKAFTGEKGMNFKVIEHVKDLTDQTIMLPGTEGFPQIVAITHPSFPPPDKYKPKETGNNGNNNNNSNNRNNNNSNNRNNNNNSNNRNSGNRSQGHQTPGRTH